EIEREPPIALQVDERLDLADVTRLAVRGKAHDLELVAVLREAEILRDREIQQAERVRKEHATIDLQCGSADTSPRRADEIAEAVNRTDSGIVEGTDKRRAGQ